MGACLPGSGKINHPMGMEWERATNKRPMEDEESGETPNPISPPFNQITCLFSTRLQNDVTGNGKG